MCVCVCERERERGGGGEKGRDRKGRRRVEERGKKSWREVRQWRVNWLTRLITDRWHHLA